MVRFEPSAPNTTSTQYHLTISPSIVSSLKDSKCFVGTYSINHWSSPEVETFLSEGSVACIGTNSQIKSNFYINAKGDCICIEW